MAVHENTFSCSRAKVYRCCSSTGLVAMLFVLGGCTSIEVALGMRTRLADVPVSELSATLSPGPGLAPGKSAQLVIVATTSDGKQLVTEGIGHGKVLFDSFTFDASVVQVNNDGVVSLPADPRLSQGKVPHIHVATNGHPGVVADLDIPVRYDIQFQAMFSGKPGFNGFDGLNGLDGMSGSVGSIDLNNPSAGGNGSDGENGRDGDDGGPGGPGEAVHVWLVLIPEAHPLLEARVAGASHEQLFLLDPNGGSLVVNASGGPGGSGGSGGRGGRGGFGGIGSPNGLNGSDGRSGLDGRRGPGGAPGSIVVSVDPQAKPFLDRLILLNKSGDGNAGPTPEVRTEAIDPLW